MISLEEAQARLLALAPLPAPETRPVADALGFYALEPLFALRDQPQANMSAMDGYAVSSSHLNGPWRVKGESAAGHPFGHAIPPNEAIRIFTGAIVPDGADTVIMQEDVARDGDWINVLPSLALKPGQHVRKLGEDFHTGDALIGKGNLINPATIGLAIAAGHDQIKVARPLKVSLISTGDELVRPGEPTEIGQIPASNDVMLSALLKTPAIQVVSVGIVMDDRVALAEALDGASDADLIITIGGASVGDHDLVRATLIEAGAQLDFWRVAMRPGKPLMAGQLNGKMVMGLPGNPVSAYVTALLFARPLLSAMLGAAHPLPRVRQARLAIDMAANGPRADHVRARFGAEGVTPVGLNDSAALFPLSRADCLIVRPINAPPAKEGDFVDVLDIA